MPVELTDESDPVWATVESTAEFLKLHGLDIGERIKFGPVSRCKESGRVWAKRVGLLKGQFTGRQDLDLVRMRQLGIRAGWSGAAERREDHTYHGVVFDYERRVKR